MEVGFRTSTGSSHLTNYLQSGSHQYNGPLKPFLEAISEEKLPPEFADIFDAVGCRFHNGENALPTLVETL